VKLLLSAGEKKHENIVEREKHESGAERRKKNTRVLLSAGKHETGAKRGST